MAAERRGLPMVRIDKEYLFEGPGGEAGLLDLFEGRRQLILYHFMFGPNQEAGCDGCSLFADQVCHLSHLHARDTSFVLVSRAPIAKIEAYRKRMGWTIPWSDSGYGDPDNCGLRRSDEPDSAQAPYSRDNAAQCGDRRGAS